MPDDTDLEANTTVMPLHEELRVEAALYPKYSPLAKRLNRMANEAELMHRRLQMRDAADEFAARYEELGGAVTTRVITFDGERIAVPARIASKVERALLREAFETLPGISTVKVTKDGVMFGPHCFYSHERITGQSAATLNADKGGLISQQYMKWVQASLAGQPAETEATEKPRRKRHSCDLDMLSPCPACDAEGAAAPPAPDYVSRLITERDQLDDRIGKLETFLDSDTFLALDWIDRTLLRNQLLVMQLYFSILLQRLQRVDAKRSQT